MSVKNKKNKQKRNYLLITVYAENAEDFKRMLNKELMDADVELDWYGYDPRKFPPRKQSAFEVEDRGNPPKACMFCEIEYGGSFRYGKDVFVRSADFGVEMGTGRRVNFNEQTSVVPVKAKLVVEDIEE